MIAKTLCTMSKHTQHEDLFDRKENHLPCFPYCAHHSVWSKATEDARNLIDMCDLREFYPG